MDYKQYWDQIHKNQNELNSLITSYWNKYSSMGDWQFWLIATTLIAPLILLGFTVNRKRIFEVFFFGFAVHMLISYSFIAMGHRGYLVHHYFITPLLPFGINMSASIIPVGFLLIYQYCTDKNKNFYLYALLLGALFSFGMGAINKYIGLTELRKGATLFHLFLLDTGVAYISYWLTRLILKFTELQPTVKEKNGRRFLIRIKEKAK